MKTCLLVIDAQQSFVQRPYFGSADIPAWLAAQNALIEGCTARGVAIVRVLHCDGTNTADNAFSQACGLVRAIDGLVPLTAAVSFIKSRHSALVGTGLDVWLTSQGVGRIIVSGIRTEQCCETTARHASDLGWKVDFVTDATLTWDMQQTDGSTLAAHDIKQRTATVLAGRFAQICSVDEALAGAAACSAANASAASAAATFPHAPNHPHRPK